MGVWKFEINLHPLFSLVNFLDENYQSKVQGYHDLNVKFKTEEFVNTDISIVEMAYLLQT